MKVNEDAERGVTPAGAAEEELRAVMLPTRLLQPWVARIVRELQPGWVAGMLPLLTGDQVPCFTLQRQTPMGQGGVFVKVYASCSEQDALVAWALAIPRAESLLG